MPIKLNGSTSGSVELNVPAAVGSDLQVTIPATAGEVIVKAADGSVDLGAVDILSDGTIATGGLTSTPGTVAAGSFVQAAANAGFFGNNGDAKFGSSANNPVLFQVNGSEKARIDISGNIAIGTSSPNSFTNYKVLTIQGTTASGIDLEKADGTIQARFFGDATGVQIGAPAGSVRFETANTERLRILSDGNVGINESTPDSKLDIRYAAGTDSATQKLIHLRTDGSSSYASRGLFVKIGRDGSYDNSAVHYDIVGSAGNSGTHIFEVQGTERMKITAAGRLFHYGDQDCLQITTNAAAGTTHVLIDASFGGSGLNSGSTSFKVFSNGNVQNTNNSYGSLSDIKLKENIVNANSQWDDLKAIQIRNYNFIEGQTHTQIGVVAQEVEAVSPGLVTESPDRDEDNNDLGTVTKSVNYSVLYMKAVKALQEAMTRIETLETKVASLEASS